VLAVVVSFIVVLYCVCALFVCNVCYLSAVLLYYCPRAEAQLQFNKYIHIYIYIIGIVSGQFSLSLYALFLHVVVRVLNTCVKYWYILESLGLYHRLQF
jgi:hypothetical protein